MEKSSLPPVHCRLLTFFNPALRLASPGFSRSERTSLSNASSPSSQSHVDLVHQVGVDGLPLLVLHVVILSYWCCCKLNNARQTRSLESSGRRGNGFTNVKHLCFDSIHFTMIAELLVADDIPLVKPLQ